MLGSFAGVADYGAFVIAIIVFLAIPGPGNLALIASTGKGGLPGGFGATFGIIAGDQVLLWAAVAGVSALMAAYPAALTSVQWLGAAYLALLGWKMLSAKPGGAPVLNMKAGHYFRQSLLITLLNPKAIVFYLAFFPLFIDPAQHRGLITFGVMAATIAVLTFLYGLAAVLLAHFLAEPARQPSRHRRFEQARRRLLDRLWLEAGLVKVSHQAKQVTRIQSRFSPASCPPSRPVPSLNPAHKPWPKYSASPTKKAGSARPPPRSTWPPAWRKWASAC